MNKMTELERNKMHINFLRYRIDRLKAKRKYPFFAGVIMGIGVIVLILTLTGKL